MDSTLNMSTDPRFLQGRALLDCGLVDDAIEFWADLLRQFGEDEKVDELNSKLAPIYYEYGNALLLKSEEAADMFGEAVQKAEQSQAKELESDSASGGGSGLDSDSLQQMVLAKQAELAEIQGQSEEDVEVAWENLDVARAIYEKAEKEEGENKGSSHQYTLPLAKVYLRLGDLSLLNGNFVTAVQDLEQCLSLRLKVLPPKCRALADVHHTLAQACLYAAADKETTNPEALREQSLSHYQTTADIFMSLISDAEAEIEITERETDSTSGSKGKEKAKVPIPISEGGHGGDSDPKKRASEFRSILQELYETIDSAKADQKIMMEQKETADNEGNTMVGFGQSSSSSSQTVSVPVKKKKKTIVSSETVTAPSDISNTNTTAKPTTTTVNDPATAVLPTTSDNLNRVNN